MPDDQKNIFKNITTAVKRKEHFSQHYPTSFNFYPSPEVIQKLIQKSLQLKGNNEWLWKGFHFVEREGDRLTWHPDVLIDPPYRLM